MNNLPDIYFTLERGLFPIVKEEFCETTEKMNELLRIIEAVRPAGFIAPAMLWRGLGTGKCRWLRF